jgi:transcriptional antiterminator NusG
MSEDKKWYVNHLDKDGKNVRVEVEKRWYVMRAISGKETKVKDYLDKQISSGDFGGGVSQVLIPMEKVVQIVNGKRVVKERNYLPGYVLVEAFMVSEIAYRLRNTPDVLGFLGGMDKPTPLRQSEVNRILGSVDELMDEGTEEVVPYNVGEVVKVIDGPFNGFMGNIEEVNNEKKTLKVMVKIFGRNTPLELGFVQVEKE